METDHKDLIEQITYLIGQIKDPQKVHQTLQDLNVITQNSVKIKKIQKKVVSLNESQNNGSNFSEKTQDYLSEYNRIEIEVVPTVPHCHLVQQIGLLIRYQLKKQLPNFERYKIKILCQQGTHKDAKSVEKQINDKQRVEAAFQNPQILQFLKSHTEIN